MIDGKRYPQPAQPKVDTLANERAVIDCLVEEHGYPKEFKEFEAALKAAQPVLVSGVVIRDGLPTLLRDSDIKSTDQRLCVTSPAAQPAPVQEPTVLDITIDDDDALSYLRDMVVQSDGDLTPIRLLAGDGHSGRGLYVASADYPEEGAIKIADLATPPAAQPKE